jgi:hypothetical protein
MKSISIRISADDEPVGAFTLDPTTTAYVLAVAKENPHLSLVEFIRESLRHHLLTDDEYDGELNDILFENIPAALLTVAVRNGLDVSTIKIPADPRN